MAPANGTSGHDIGAILWLVAIGAVALFGKIRSVVKRVGRRKK